MRAILAYSTCKEFEMAKTEKKEEVKEKTAHACEQPGSAHWFGNDGQCVFCRCHRDPK